MTGSRRQGALLLWISGALVGGALALLGLVGFGLLLSHPSRGSRADWLIAGGVLALGTVILAGSIAMGRRLLRQRP